MDIDLELEMKYIYEGNPYDYERVEYEVVRHGEQFGMNMGYLDCNDIWCSNVLAAQAGEWDIRAYIRYNHPTYGYQFVYSNVVTLEIFYPEVDNIKVDPTIVSEMEDAWNAAVNASGPGNLEERGFSIYGNTTSGSLVYEVKYGNPSPGGSSEETEIIINYTGESKVYPRNGVKFSVAWFHTHPPHRWCTGCRRTGIPSPEDNTISTNKKIPGILMDYKEFSLCYDHDLDLNTGLKTFGPGRRIYDENILN